MRDGDDQRLARLRAQAKAAVDSLRQGDEQRADTVIRDEHGAPLTPQEVALHMLGLGPIVAPIKAALAGGRAVLSEVETATEAAAMLEQGLGSRTLARAVAETLAHDPVLVEHRRASAMDSLLDVIRELERDETAELLKALAAASLAGRDGR